MEQNREETNPTKYESHSNRLPFIIALAWIILIVWGVFYSIKYAIPDLQEWLSR